MSYCFIGLQSKYDVMKTALDSLTASSVDIILLTKIKYLSSRAAPQFNKYEALELLDALKNAAHDARYNKAEYYKMV